MIYAAPGMGIDLVIHFECQPKLALGRGDAMNGTIQLVDLLKAKSRADVLVQHMTAKGQDPRTTKVKLVLEGPHGPQETEVTAAELGARAAPLAQLYTACNGCPARTSDSPFACTSYVNYPIPALAEQWLMERLQPRTMLGGMVCLAAIEDFGWDGSPLAAYRQRGLFESPHPVRRDLGDGAVVSSDSVLQAMMAVGALGDMHSVILLSWFGAVLVDGAPVLGSDKSALGTVMSIPVEQRAARTRFVLPAPPPDAPHLGTFLWSAYCAWRAGAELLVDS